MTPHLHPSILKLLELPNKERQQAILADKWIPYPRAQQALAQMGALVDHPPSHRMPNLLLVGDTNNGKTAILRHFEAAYPPGASVKDGQRCQPVLYVQAPPEPDERRLYNAVLDRLNFPHQVREHIDKKHLQVLHVLRKLQVKVLIIDEIQHVLAGTQMKQRLFLNVLKHLSNELEMPLVCAGIRTAFNAVQTDEQLANRFKPFALPKWTLGDDYRRLLLSFETLLPLRQPSNLSDDVVALKILSLSQGTIGEISTVLKQAAVLAIATKAERITVAVLNKIDFISPADRTKFKTA